MGEESFISLFLSLTHSVCARALVAHAHTIYRQMTAEMVSERHLYRLCGLSLCSGHSSFNLGSSCSARQKVGEGAPGEDDADKKVLSLGLNSSDRATNCCPFFTHTARWGH